MDPIVPNLLSLRLLVPPLASSSYKGQAGKVGVVGGCAEYTGAPFYAALSALKLGADLSHVFCDEQAAVPIKSYSPELIVHGCLRSGDDEKEAIVRQADEVSKWFPALSALVVGPGLGRDPALQAVAATVVERAISASLPCVIDADALRLVIDRPQLVQGSKWTCLTPNKPEFGRLLDKFDMSAQAVENEQQCVIDLAARLDGPMVIRKGVTDLISDGKALLENAEPGCLKRSGGQGDVLAGSIATVLGWARSAEAHLPTDAASAPLLAAYTGCMLTRRFAAAAFAKQRRSMTAPDLIDAIGPVFEEFCPSGDA